MAEPVYQPGRLLKVAGTVLPGVRHVQDQIVPYAAAWRAANAAALAESGPLWVALGDSMTQGIGARTIAGGWVGQARVQLSAAGLDYRLVNLSVSGARIRDVTGPQLDALAALGIKPSLVTVLIGANDMLVKSRREQVPADFAALLTRLPRGSVVATLPQPRRMAVAANRLIERAAAEGHIRIAEMRGGLRSFRGTLAEDHFHPNEVGYARIAAIFTSAIQPASPRA